MSVRIRRFAYTSLIIAAAFGATAHGKDAAAAGDWGKFYNSLRAVPVKDGSVVELKAGDAIRFQGVTKEWCGEKNSGLEVMAGNGAIHDADPMSEARRMNSTGDYGMVRIAAVEKTSFFVASFTPTKIKLVVADWKKLGQECGE